MIARRSFTAALLAACAAPAFVKAGVLMPVKTLTLDDKTLYIPPGTWTIEGGVLVRFKEPPPYLDFLDIQGNLLASVPMPDIRPVPGDKLLLPPSSYVALRAGTIALYSLRGTHGFDCSGSVGNHEEINMTSYAVTPGDLVMTNSMTVRRSLICKYES